MSDTLMLLPARDPGRIRLVRVPSDYEAHEAFRHLTAIIGDLEEKNPDYGWDELADELESQGFVPVEFVLGPDLD